MAAPTPQVAVPAITAAGAKPRKKRRLSAAGRKAIIEATRKRWAEQRKREKEEAQRREEIQTRRVAALAKARKALATSRKASPAKAAAKRSAKRSAKARQTPVAPAAVTAAT